MGTAALTKMVSSFAAVEAEMKKLESTSTPVFETMDEAMRRSLDRAIAFSNAFVFSTQEVVNASIELASAGLNVEETIASVEQAAFLAVAGLGNFRDAATLLGSELNTLGKSGALSLLDPFEKAKRIADSTALALIKFQVTLPVLEEGLKFVVGPATQLGVSIDELNASIGLLNTLGLRASLAGTALGQVLSELPQAIDKLQLDPRKFTTAEGNLTSLADVLQEIDRRLPTNNFDRMTKLIEAFDIRAARAVVTLLQNVDALKRHTRDLEGAEGAAERLARTVGSSLTGNLQVLRNNVQNLFIALGEKLAPVVKKATEFLVFLGGTLQKLPDPMRRFALAVFFATTALTALAFLRTALGLMFDVLGAGTTKLTIEQLKNAIATRIASDATKEFALSTAILQLSIGNVATALAVFSVLAISVGITLGSFGDSAERAASRLDFTNSSLEGLSTTIGRVVGDIQVLERVTNEGFQIEVGAREVVAFSDLIDFGGRGALDEELRKLESRKVHLEFLFEPVHGFERREPEFEFDRMRASILRLSEEGLGTLALEDFARKVADIRGPTADVTAIFEATRREFDQLGLGIREADLFLSVFKRRFDEAFREKTGIELDVREIESFVANVERMETALVDLRSEAGKEAGVNSIDVPPTARANIEALFKFVQDNLEQIRKFDPEFERKFRAKFEIEGRGFAKLDEIVEKTGDGLEAQGEFELFTNDTARNVSAEFARMVLPLKDSLTVALRAAEEDASSLSGALALKLHIQENLIAPIDQFGERIKQVEKNAEQAGKSFDVKVLAEQDALLRSQVDRIHAAKGANELLVRTLEEKLKLVAGDVVKSAEINQELAQALQLQTSLTEQLGESDKSAERVRQNFLLLARVRLPDVAEQLRLEDLAKTGDLKLSFQIESDVRKQVDGDVRAARDAIKSLEAERFDLQASVTDSEAFGEDTAPFRRMVESRIDRINQEIARRNERIKGLEVSVQTRVDEATAEAADRRIAEIARTRGISLEITSAEQEALSRGIEGALKKGLETGRTDEFSKTLGSEMKEELQKGVVQGMTSGLLISLAVGDLQAFGKKVGDLIFRQAVEGEAAAGEELNTLFADLSRRVASIEEPEFRGKIAEGLVQAFAAVDRVARMFDGTLIDMETSSEKALSPLVRDLATLLTKVQLADETTRAFLEQILALRSGEGFVRGMDIGGLDVQHQLETALALMREIRESGLGGDLASELTKEIDRLNERILQAKQGMARVPAGATGEVRPVPASPTSSLQKIDQAMPGAKSLVITVEVDAALLAINRVAQAMDGLTDRSVRIDVAPHDEHFSPGGPRKRAVGSPSTRVSSLRPSRSTTPPRTERSRSSAS